MPYKRKKMKVSHPNEMADNVLELTSAEMDIDSDSEEKNESPNLPAATELLIGPPLTAPLPPPLPSSDLIDMPLPPPERTPDSPSASLPIKAASHVSAFISRDSPTIVSVGAKLLVDMIIFGATVS